MVSRLPRAAADVTDFADVAKPMEDALQCIVPTLYGLLTTRHAEEYAAVIQPPMALVLVSTFGPELVGINSAPGTVATQVGASMASTDASAGG